MTNYHLRQSWHSIYFRLFYEYFEEKVSKFLFVKSGSVIIFFWYNFVANFAREYERSHDNNVLVDSRTFKYFFIVLIIVQIIPWMGYWWPLIILPCIRYTKYFYVYYFKAVLCYCTNDQWQLAKIVWLTVSLEYTKTVCTSVGSTNVKMLCWVVILLP
jgi:hypothetical protein